MCPVSREFIDTSNLMCQPDMECQCSLLPIQPPLLSIQSSGEECSNNNPWMLEETTTWKWICPIIGKCVVCFFPIYTTIEDQPSLQIYNALEYVILKIWLMLTCIHGLPLCGTTILFTRLNPCLTYQLGLCPVNHIGYNCGQHMHGDRGGKGETRTSQTVQTLKQA